LTPFDVTIAVPMLPRQQDRIRARAVTAGGKTFAKTYQETGSSEWKERLAHAVSRQLDAVLEGPIRIDILLVWPRTKALSKVFARPRPGGYGPDKRAKYPVGLLPKTTIPDRDNCEKAVLDALKPFWQDDKLVCLGETVKAWAELGGLGRVVIRLQSVAPGDVQARACALGLVPKSAADVRELIRGSKKRLRELRRSLEALEELGEVGLRGFSLGRVPAAWEDDAQ